jgi:hypothetical protein
VVQSHGMVLEGSMPVGHGGMPCVAGLGEEAEVREAKASDQGRTGLPLSRRWGLLGSRMQEHAREKRRQGTEQGQAEGGFAHEQAWFQGRHLQDSLHSMLFRRTGLISWKVRILCPR